MLKKTHQYKQQREKSILNKYNHILIFVKWQHFSKGFPDEKDH